MLVPEVSQVIVGSKGSANNKSGEEKQRLCTHCKYHVANLVTGVVSVAFMSGMVVHAPLFNKPNFFVVCIMVTTAAMADLCVMKEEGRVIES